MNPATLLAALQALATLAPALYQDYEAIKQAGSATTDQQAALDAQIEAMDAKRLVDWAAADTALDKAAGQ